MDVAFRGHENQHVAAVDPRRFLHRRPHGILQVGLVALFVRFHRPPEHFHRISPARNLDDGGRASGAPGHGKMFGEAARIDGSRRNNHPQFRPFGQQPFQVTDQKIDVQRPFVGLVEDNRVVAVEIRVALCSASRMPSVMSLM